MWQSHNEFYLKQVSSKPKKDITPLYVISAPFLQSPALFLYIQIIRHTKMNYKLYLNFTLHFLKANGLHISVHYWCILNVSCLKNSVIGDHKQNCTDLDDRIFIFDHFQRFQYFLNSWLIMTYPVSIFQSIVGFIQISRGWTYTTNH